MNDRGRPTSSRSAPGSRVGVNARIQHNAAFCQVAPVANRVGLVAQPLRALSGSHNERYVVRPATAAPANQCCAGFSQALRANVGVNPPPPRGNLLRPARATLRVTVLAAYLPIRPRKRGLPKSGGYAAKHKQRTSALGMRSKPKTRLAPQPPAYLLVAVQAKPVGRCAAWTGGKPALCEPAAKGKKPTSFSRCALGGE